MLHDIYRARVLSTGRGGASAEVDLGFGVHHLTRLQLTVPGQSGGRAVRQWLAAQNGEILLRVLDPGGRGRLRAELLDGDPPYIYRMREVRVVDGDTLQAQIMFAFDVSFSATLRLSGVNAPEKNTSEGVRACDWVRSWVACQGAELMVSTVKDRREKYGRLLATVYGPGGGRSLNEELLAEGLAQSYDGGRRRE